MKFEAEVFCPEGETVSWLISATGVDGVNLPAQSYTRGPGTHNCVYGPHPAQKAFPSEIRFYGPGIGTFSFDWEIKQEDKVPSVFETSQHRIYLTVATPTCLRGNKESLFYYACHQPNGYAGSNGALVTDMIWNDFSIKAMERIDSESGYMHGGNMTFWPGVAGQDDILVAGGGVCDEWSTFFCDVLNVHAYSSEIVDVRALGMIFDDGKAHHGTVWFVVGSSMSWGGPPINGGHGPGAPPKNWAEHTIATAFDKLYDASYGVSGTDPADYENRAVAWYAYQYTIGVFTRQVYQKRDRKSTHKLKYTPRP